MNTAAAGILLWCFIASYLGFRSSFFGLKLVASMSWFGWVIYVIDHPPFDLVAGEGTHIALIVVSIGLALMITLAGLGRGIDQTRDRTGAFSIKTQGFSLKLPGFLKDSGAVRKQKRQQSTDEYAEQFHRALHPHKRR